MLQLISFKVHQVIGSWPVGVEYHIRSVSFGLEFADGFGIWLSLEDPVTCRNGFVGAFLFLHFLVSSWYLSRFSEACRMSSSVRSASVEGSMLFCVLMLLYLSSSGLSFGSVEQPQWSESYCPTLCGIMWPDDLREFVRPFAIFQTEQAFFDACKDDAIGAFYCTIRLWVIDRCKHDLHSYWVIEFLEELAIKLFAIVDS